MVRLRDPVGMADELTLPSGTVTFLFTDVEGSTRLWAADSEAMSASLLLHDAVVRSAIESAGGYVFTAAGDSFSAAFSRASDAVSAAAGIQRGLDETVWPGPMLRVRIGVHLGEAEERGGDYFGPVVNTAARVEAAGHGGQTLLTEPVRAAARVVATDLGVHELRDVDEPVRLFQFGDGKFPAVRALGSFPSNLPEQRSSFIGRRDELATIVASTETNRLVTLTGVGGVGKTRLSLRAAGDLLSSFADGAWLCELAPVNDLGGIVEVVSSAMGIDQQQGMSLEESLLAGLRRRRALVVLDNCEHVLDDVADLVEGVLDTCPEIHVLATSREGLALDGERLIAIPALGVPRRARCRLGPERWSCSWIEPKGSRTALCSPATIAMRWWSCVVVSTASLWRSSWPQRG